MQHDRLKEIVDKTLQSFTIECYDSVRHEWYDVTGTSAWLEDLDYRVLFKYLSQIYYSHGRHSVCHNHVMFSSYQKSYFRYADKVDYCVCGTPAWSCLMDYKILKDGVEHISFGHVEKKFLEDAYDAQEPYQNLYDKAYYNAEAVATRTEEEFNQEQIDLKEYDDFNLKVAQSNVASHQVGGTHYEALPLEPWDAMRIWMTDEQYTGFLIGNAIKYLARFNRKGGKQDIKKARSYLDKYFKTFGED